MFKHNFFIHDFENQNIPWYGSVASPHNPDNYIVATGYCIDGGDIQAHYFNSDEEAVNHKWIDKLQDCKMYVCHNSTFEIQWMMRTYPKQFLAWIKKGGKVFCTQYAEYILTHQLEMYPKLEDCAIKYGGSKKIDEVKLLWEQGVLTADIDKALLMKYLADPKLGDVANTRRVCFSQVALLRKNGMWDMFMERMDSLLFNAIASYQGLYVDMQVAERNQKAQEIEIETIKSSILDMLPSNLPNDFEFSFTSAYHLSAFLFGGTIQYKAKVSYDPVKYVKKDCYQVTKGAEIGYFDVSGFSTVPTQASIKDGWVLTTFKAGKNKGQPKVFKVETTEELLKWGDKQYKFDGLLDFSTLPNIVSEAYTGKRAEFCGKRTLVDGTPIYSTGKDSLDVLAAHTDVAKPLKNLAALIKDTTTYYLVVDDKGKESGMLQFVEPNGIIHHQLNNCATITGRLSSSRPNLQNVPRDGTSKVKEMFSSRFGTEGRIVEVDYSALEVVALASISGDENLMRMLIEGIDMHCYRLAAKLGEDYDSVVEKCNNKEHPEHKLYKQMRTDIKPRAFAHQYGASAAGIAFSTGCTLEDAHEFKQIEFKLFPESNAFPAKFVRPMVEQTGSASQPIREFDEETGRYNVYRRGHFQAKSGTCYSFRQFDKWDKELRQTVKDYKDTQIANYWCQGEASFIVQAACGRVIRELIKRDFANGLVLPINTVHDAIYLDCATEALAKEYGALVRDIMEATPKYLAEAIPALKEWNYQTTPFPAQAECGVNMMNKEHI